MRTATLTFTLAAPGPPNSTIPAAAASVAVHGDSGLSTVTVAISGGFSSAVALSATGQPTGVTGSFTPAAIPAPGSGTSTMTMAVGPTPPIGTYPITVIGSGGGPLCTRPGTLTVDQTLPLRQ